MSNDFADLPLYQCHKRVRAFKIACIVQSPADHVFPGGSWEILPSDPLLPRATVGHEWFGKHRPEAGGYFVVYEDGYFSYSPAAAFEGGYTPVR